MTSSLFLAKNGIIMITWNTFLIDPEKIGVKPKVGLVCLYLLLWCLFFCFAVQTPCSKHANCGANCVVPVSDLKTSCF